MLRLNFKQQFVKRTEQLTLVLKYLTPSEILSVMGNSNFSNFGHPFPGWTGLVTLRLPVSQKPYMQL
jgi:hypothetical protein